LLNRFQRVVTTQTYFFASQIVLIKVKTVMADTFSWW